MTKPQYNGGKEESVGFFEKTFSVEVEDLIAEQLKLQVKVSFPKQYDFLVRHCLKNCETVLDYGTGNGSFCCELAKRYPNIKFTGIDLKEDMIARAIKLSDEKSISNIEWSVDNVLAQKKSKEVKQYDGIILRYVAMHVPQTELLFKNLFKLLKPEGHIWIFDSNLEDYWCKPESKAFTAYHEAMDKFAHKHGSDLHIAQKIPQYLEKTGFKNIHSEIDDTSSNDIGLKTLQELLIREVRILNHYDPEIVTQTIVDNLRFFLESEMPKYDHHIQCGISMIAAKGDYPL